MKRIIFVLILSFVFGIAGYDLSSASQAGEGFDPPGLWLGTLSFGGADLRIVVKIVKTEDGRLKATMDSPDQGAKDIPVDSLSVEDDALFFEIRSVNGSYRGTFNPAAGEIEGTWTQGGVALPLNLKRVDKVPELARPQEPKRPFPYLEDEVAYENAKALIKLAGTLTLPRAGGRVPAVVLITGSGGQDRDEAILGHKPFMVIADYLTRRGIAVLRVDDRGVGGSTGSLSTSTSKDLAGDVRAGIDYLRGRPEIDARRIGLLGHSEGGMIAPMIAADSRDVAFIVLLAGIGVTGEQILYEQGQLIARAEGTPEDVIAGTLEFQKRTFALVKETADVKVLEEKLRPLCLDLYRALPEDQRKAIGSEDLWVKGQITALTSPWFRYFLTYDPKPALKKVKCPVLALGGGKDLQVPAAENLKAIEDALRAGGNKNYTVRELADLNHLFQTAKTGGVSEYAKIEETFSPAILQIIGDWIMSVTGPGKTDE